MANLYYREELADADFAVGGLVEIAGEEARHALRVSRLRAGERILVGNGRGAVGGGLVETADRDRFAVRIDEAVATPGEEPRPSLVLVQALAKGDRDERAVEQATEFGVDRILPWEARRSVSTWRPRGGPDKSARGVEKWRRIAREAAKQSLRARIPAVGEPLGLRELAEAAAVGGAAVVVLHPRGAASLTAWAATPEARGLREILVVVGPEGGLAEDELDALERAGARVAVLGGTVLRTSSAGPAAIAVLNAALGRW
ncbi:16S rRNA (uracil(1498)-N(3))-methyltransferase [Leucobacter allii]|uniref:Ribosomal RNA small subunit methyltransferase E n=1 Tax=Leucobacter allii TaxID=2932247 RepID=A0ABY4FR16_9MICO|nr:16S rRNA (uracil(1498)-N(3))-methyltransferase [Leucobacter allii]UOQ58707.1 16S rRNA (uracil(1498)-N(3))-methyltransferase [Leucobacter allii]UOR03234.1 16S rRNA (uracil(1498)-N(3))-methyltransferase [Leucobacter allii]